MDLELMKRLHRKVNIVVVIAKADTLTSAEVRKLKQRILKDIEDNQIQVRNQYALALFVRCVEYSCVKHRHVTFSDLPIP